jgi:hypothetical protein
MSSVSPKQRQKEKTTMIKNILTAAMMVIVAASAHAQGYHYTRGYITRSGSYVPSHYATNPNGNRFDNWSTIGNYNPFTGQPGYRPAYPGFSGYSSQNSGLQHYSSLFGN